MKETTIGAQITEEGLEFFGLEEVNALIQQGHRVREIQEGQMLLDEVLPEESGEEEASYTVAGFEMTVILEEAA